MKGTSITWFFDLFVEFLTSANYQITNNAAGATWGAVYLVDFLIVSTILGIVVAHFIPKAR